MIVYLYKGEKAREPFIVYGGDIWFEWRERDQELCLYNLAKLTTNIFTGAKKPEVSVGGNIVHVVVKEDN